MKILQFNKKYVYPEFPEKMRGELPKKELLEFIPLELAREFQAFVFDKDLKSVKIAAVDPSNSALQRYARERFGGGVLFFRATASDVSLIIKNYVQDLKSEILELSSAETEVNGNLSKIVDSIIKYGLTEKASDIHIEPGRNETAVRFRIDGVLHNVFNLPRRMHQAIIARFKIMANLKIDEYRRPQDGRIEPEEFPNISLRISIIPTLFGEKVALRLLDDSNASLFINKLGFSKDQENILIQEIDKPFGMVITSGPTGSGKTTTLYALLHLIKKDGLNISTLEDPIEYVMDGVNQIQTNHRVDLTFASGLRSLLRQDPDIIMVGEVRDSETAVMATNAAMTGHLVFTTMHTNDASSAFTRLLEMKVEDFVVSSTVNLVVAQRLVRKICASCAKKNKLEGIVLKKIRERNDIMAALNEKQKGLANSLGSRTFNVGTGCKSCLNTGYLGRIGLFELLRPNKEIHDLILQHVSTERIKLAAQKNGFKDMIIDGIEKVFAGVTTFDEVLRTTRNA